MLVQFVFWGFIGALYQHIDLGVPFGGPSLIHADTNTLITVFVAAILGLGLNEGAYMAEIVRAGLDLRRRGTDRGRTRARALADADAAPDRACRRRCG